MEVPANELVRGDHDSGTGNLSGAAGATSARSIRSGTDSTAEARAVHLQLQGRGSGLERTGESAGAEAKFAHCRSLPCKSRRLQAAMQLGLSIDRWRSVDKGSEVPAGWKPPHAELNAAAVSAAAVSHQWESGVATPTPGADGRVVYVFGQGMPVMVCAPLRVCAVELQAGEHLQSQPQIGDSRRWEITPVLSGSGLDVKAAA